MREVRRRKLKARMALVEIFEQRILLSGTYGAGDLDGPWAIGGLSKAGGISFDGVSGVTAAAWANESGTGQVLSGTSSAFTVAAQGAASVSLETVVGSSTVSSVMSLQGISNATRDVVALNEVDTGVPMFGGLDLLVRHAGSFAGSDLAGTWNIAAADFRGTVTINAAGHVIGGLLYRETTQKSAKITGGSATLNANGTGTLALNTAFSGVNAGFATVALDITMNDSKDVVVANSSSIGQPASSSGTVPAELTVLTKAAGKYASSDVAGVTWTMQSALGMGTVTFNANKTISGTLTSDSGTVAVLTGNYAVGGNGTLNINFTATAGATVSHFTLTGAINRSRNLVALDRAIVNPGTHSSLTILISAANHLPTEAAKAVLPVSAFQSSSLTIDYATVLAASAAHDLDRDSLSFLLTAAPAANGTLSITHNGTTSAVIAGTTMIAPGDTLTWMPASNVQGQIDAFSVKAFDGDALAATATKLFVSTLPKAVGSAKTTRGSALETKAGTHAGDGKILVSRVGGDLTLPLNVTLAIAGTGVQGTNYNLLAPDGVTILASPSPVVTIPAGAKAVTIFITPLQDSVVDPTLTAVVTVAPDPNATASQYVPSVHASGHVDIVDSSPLVTITARKPGITEGGVSTQAFLVERLPAQGGNVSGTLTVSLNYGGTFDTAGSLVAPASVTFAAGEVKKIVTLTTIDNHSANATQTLTATISGGGFAIDGPATVQVNVLDAAPVVSVKRDRSTAQEAHPATKTAKFTVSRTGSTANALTVEFSTASGGTFGTLGTHYSLADSSGNPLTTGVVIPAGKKSMSVLLTAIDDGANDPTLTPVITLLADGGPSYHVGTADHVTLKILNNDRRPVVANGTVSQSTSLNTALNLPYGTLASLMGAALAPGETHGTLQLKVAAKNSGTLQIIPNGGLTPIAAPVGTVVEAGDTLVWTPPAGAQGVTLKAFTLSAIDGTLLSAVSSKFSVEIS
ncbi:MAG TPA: hypothetical protein VHM90_00425 [Phycisphaerae bacterium]|nr:hypothetical protein [Phycisphaerae bacterium]